MEEKTELQKRAVELVTEQIISMLDNNVLKDCGVEGFAGWCEDGDVFFNNENLSGEQIEAATQLMKEVAPLMDDLTYKFLNLGH